MAWENITYKCGHAKEEKMFGPGRERQRKIEAAKSRLCPDCWRRERENNPPNPIAHVRRIPPGKSNLSLYRIEIIVTESFSIKDELKARGYRFSEYDLDPNSFAGLMIASRGNFFDFLSRPTKAWGLILEALASDDAQKLCDRFKDEVAWLASVGCQIAEKNISADGFYLASASLKEGRSDLL